MTRNVGTADRLARATAAAALLSCTFLAPLPLAVRLVAFLAPGLYMLGTALAGHCIGYRLMGRNTCALPSRS
jgi:hypothetical protein